MYKNIGILADNSRHAREAKEALAVQYSFANIEDTNIDELRGSLDLIIVLGGDGFMLHSLHEFMEEKIPFYGMNCGSVGFLLNEYKQPQEDLMERLANAKTTYITPLKMAAVDDTGEKVEALAINEVSLLRESRQTAHIAIHIDGGQKMEKLVSDGVLLATPAGSTAYNFSAGGPVVPLESNVLALTPISPFRPRRWRGALLSDKVEVTFEVLNAHKRPVSAVADYTEIRHVKEVAVSSAPEHRIQLLFDPGHSLEERIIKEQFVL